MLKFVPFKWARKIAERIGTFCLTIFQAYASIKIFEKETIKMAFASEKIVLFSEKLKEKF